MSLSKSDEELKLTRRLFLQHTATATAATAVSATFYSVAMKTDAIAQAAAGQVGIRGIVTDGFPYPYVGG